jgi:hypothetical protein
MSIVSRICLACTVLLIASCSEEQISKVGLRGSLTGYVRGYKPSVGTSPLENVEVILEGTDPLVTIYTDSNGKFQVPELVTGTYHLTFKKVGYGTYKIPGYSFVGGDLTTTISNVTLYSLPDIQIKDVGVSITRYGDVAYGTITIFTDNPESGTTSGYFRYFLSQEEEVSSSQYQETRINGYYFQGSSHSLQTNFDVKRFPVGTNLYMIIYPCTDQYSYYVDLETGKKIYTSIGESNTGIITIKIPN